MDRSKDCVEHTQASQATTSFMAGETAAHWREALENFLTYVEILWEWDQKEGKERGRGQGTPSVN